MPGTELKLDLVIRAVTCPGVWLCPKGCVTLALELFNVKFRTKPVPPLFPLVYNTSFKFTKNFEKVDNPKDMANELANDQLHCKLLQWPRKPNQGKARILATYIGAVEDLLYSPEIYTDSKVDLLMKAAPIFPGIIVPKIEMIKRLSMSGLPEGPEAFTTTYESVFFRNSGNRDIKDIDDSQCEQYCKIDAGRKENFWMMNLGHMARQRIVCHHPKKLTCGTPAK